MVETAVLGGVLGVVLVAVGAAAVLREKLLVKFLEETSEGSIGLVFGLFEAAIGLLMVYIHNVWVLGYQVVITLIGWYLLIDGAADLLIPEKFKERVSGVLEDNEEESYDISRSLGVMLVVLGAYLIYSVL
jgi:hypothetical protein